MEAHAVCEDLSSENHQALCQVIFSSGFFFLKDYIVLKQSPRRLA